MQQSKKSVTARIPIELYDKCNQHHENMTDAVIAGLELLCKTECKTDCNQCNPYDKTDCKTDCKTDGNQCNTDVITINVLQSQIKNLEDRLSKAPDPSEFAQLHARYEETEKEINTRDKEIEFLKSQITIKDQQLDKQAFSLQSVIQENSRLNVKLLPEAQEAKKDKPWWRFW